MPNRRWTTWPPAARDLSDTVSGGADGSNLAEARRMGTNGALDRLLLPRDPVLFHRPWTAESPAVAGLSELSGRPDLNRGPHRPERCALPGCATPRRAPSIDRAYGRPSPATAE